MKLQDKINQSICNIEKSKILVHRVDVKHVHMSKDGKKTGTVKGIGKVEYFANGIWTMAI